MKVVGLTGGIGSGKSTVAEYFRQRGIPIYIADDEAKALMNRSKVIKHKLTSLLGESAYLEGQLNRPYIARKVFKDKQLLQQINAIVHPKVASHFKRWLSRQKAPYIIKEAAIIFENNLEDQYDKIITIVTPLEERIERIMKRDGSTRDKILAIVANQLPDEEKIEKSDFVVYNHNLTEVEQQVERIHQMLLSMA